MDEASFVSSTSVAAKDANLHVFTTSKAVIQALKALQDKIKRLAHEKAELFDECCRLSRRLDDEQESCRRQATEAEASAAAAVRHLQHEVNSLREDVQHAVRHREEAEAREQESTRLQRDARASEERRLRDDIEVLTGQLRESQGRARDHWNAYEYERARAEEESKARRSLQERFEARVAEDTSMLREQLGVCEARVVELRGRLERAETTLAVAEAAATDANSRAAAAEKELVAVRRQLEAERQSRQALEDEVTAHGYRELHAAVQDERQAQHHRAAQGLEEGRGRSRRSSLHESFVTLADIAERQAAAAAAGTATSAGSTARERRSRSRNRSGSVRTMRTGLGADAGAVEGHDSSFLNVSALTGSSVGHDATGITEADGLPDNADDAGDVPLAVQGAVDYHNSGISRRSSAAQVHAQLQTAYGGRVPFLHPGPSSASSGHPMTVTVPVPSSSGQGRARSADASYADGSVYDVPEAGQALRVTSRSRSPETSFRPRPSANLLATVQASLHRQKMAGTGHSQGRGSSGSSYNTNTTEYREQYGRSHVHQGLMSALPAVVSVDLSGGRTNGYQANGSTARGTAARPVGNPGPMFAYVPPSTASVAGRSSAKPRTPGSGTVAPGPRSAAQVGRAGRLDVDSVSSRGRTQGQPPRQPRQGGVWPPPVPGAVPLQGWPQAAASARPGSGARPDVETEALLAAAGAIQTALAQRKAELEASQASGGMLGSSAAIASGHAAEGHSTAGTAPRSVASRRTSIVRALHALQET